MLKRRAIVWFRQDLRLHDNEALTEALRFAEEIIPVYVFDERVWHGNTHNFGFRKMGPYRAKFMLEGLADLRTSLQEKNSELILLQGLPEVVVPALAQQTGCSWVFCNRDPIYEEAQVQDKMEKQLWSMGMELRYTRGKMLYYTADLPFPVAHTPDVFSQFRKEVEKFVPVRQPLPAPVILPKLSVKIESGALPSIESFGHAPFEQDSRTAFPYSGGEKAALQRLQQYLWDSHLIKKYKETRNGLLGPDYSSKFSPWLAQGSLSPKYIYHEVKKYEAKHGGNESTYWLIFELLWRDFFRLMGKKHGSSIFMKGGTRRETNMRWRDDWKFFDLWKNGLTGFPFVDANMREIAQTGFMSNRGRQNVASFLVRDLGINWQMGAEYFESILLDYDVCSNWGNWNYVAGVGSDPREDRYFNVLVQAKRYDPDGSFVRQWLPELKNLPSDRIHQPETLSLSEQTRLACKLGAHYPLPIVRLPKKAIY